MAARLPRVRFIGETYRLLFEKNPLPMWVYDIKNLHFLAVNDAAVAHYGYTRNEFLRMTVKDIRPPEDVPALLKEIAGLESSTETIGIWRHLKRDGTVIDVEVLGNEIDFEDHRARLILAHDITQRVRVERRLRTEFAVTRVLMDAPHAIEAGPRLLRAVCEEVGWEYGEFWLASRGDEVLRWQSAWHVEGFPSRRLEEESRTLTVRRGVGIPGTSWATGRAEWIEDLTPQTNFARVQAAAELRLRQALSFPIVGRDRRVLGVMLFFSRIAREPDPEFLDLMADLGDRIGQYLEGERSEAERAQAEERFSKAFHESPTAAAITRLSDGTIIDVNERFLEAYEYTREEVLGRTSKELAIWSDPAQRERILAPVRRGDRVRGLEERFRTKSGRSWTALVFVEPISLSDEPTILTTLVDVTSLRRAQEALLESERLASVGRTAAYVAHELNTPLTNISLLTASIRRQTQEEGTRERLERIDVQRRIASRIIEEILTFTRPTALRREDADLAALVRAATEQAAAYRRPGVELALEVGEEPVPVSVDLLKVSQAFVNLIKNAYQATDAGRVTVSLRKEGQGVRVAVRDTGRGIPPEARDRIFEPFYTTKPHGEGVGLGLGFTRAVIEGHGGRVDLEPADGPGTTFIVRLPLAPAAS